MRKIKLGNERLLVKFYTVRARLVHGRVSVQSAAPRSFSHPPSPPHPVPSFHPQLDESLMTPAQKAPLPNHGVCKPIFLLYKVRPPRTHMHCGRRNSWGVSPLLLVRHWFSPFRSPFPHTTPTPATSTSSPLSQNKVLVGKIAGVNAPELETQVVDNANEAVEEE